MTSANNITKKGASSVSRVRNKAEQYKPKTPSRLRHIDQTSPYDSKSDQTPQSAAKADQVIITVNADKTITAPSPNCTANKQLPVGTPHWLKLQCPAGDLSTLPWPESKPIANATSTDAMRLVQSQWTANSDKTTQYWKEKMEAAAQLANGRAPLTVGWPEARPANASFAKGATDMVQSKWTGHKKKNSIDHWKERMEKV